MITSGEEAGEYDWVGPCEGLWGYWLFQFLELGVCSQRGSSLGIWVIKMGINFVIIMLTVHVSLMNY